MDKQFYAIGSSTEGGLRYWLTEPFADPVDPGDDPVDPENPADPGDQPAPLLPSGYPPDSPNSERLAPTGDTLLGAAHALGFVAVLSSCALLCRARALRRKR